MGIPRCGLKASPHSSLLVDEDASHTVEQAQLGHTDLHTTLGIHTHVIRESHGNAIEKVAEVLDLSGPPPEGNPKWIQ